MAPLFLSSRAEILRALSLDTGRNLLLVGAPKEFIDYIEKVVPAESIILKNENELKEGALFKIIVLWAEDRDKLGCLNVLTSHLADDSDLWVVVKRQAEQSPEIKELSRNPIPEGIANLPITFRLDLVPVLIRNRKR